MPAARQGDHGGRADLADRLGEPRPAVVPDQLPDASVGVFMGIMSTDYAQLRERLAPSKISGANGAGLSHSAGVGRVNGEVVVAVLYCRKEVRNG